jgi:hypothetical protein
MTHYYLSKGDAEWCAKLLLHGMGYATDVLSEKDKAFLRGHYVFTEDERFVIDPIFLLDSHTISYSFFLKLLLFRNNLIVGELNEPSVVQKEKSVPISEYSRDNPKVS